MSNDLMNYNPGQATLLEMRADSQRFPRIKTMTDEEAVSRLSRIVTQAFLYRGQAADPNNIQFISSALLGEIRQDRELGLSDLSMAEIQVLVKREILKDDMFISVASLYRIIREYAKGEGHRNQVVVNNRKREETPVSPIIKAYAGALIRNNKKAR